MFRRAKEFSTLSPVMNENCVHIKNQVWVKEGDEQKINMEYRDGKRQ